MIELSNVIASLRSELRQVGLEGAGRELGFELGPVELEISVAVEKMSGGRAAVKFWVVELGAGDEISSNAIQRIKLTLNPRLTDAASVNAMALSERSVFVHGSEVEGER